MDVDLVVEVPDTPDRSASKNINGKNCIRREGHVSSMGNLFENGDVSDVRLPGRPRNNNLATKSESRSIPPTNGSNKSELQGHIINIASETAHSSRAAFNSKRNVLDHTFNHGGKNSIQPDYMGKGKAPSSSHSQMPAYQGHGNFFDLTECDGHSKVCQKLVTGSSQSEQHRKEMSDKSFSPLLIADDSDIGGKIDNPRISHKISSQKKLVRNGCISPLNVAKAKQSAQKQNNTFLHSHLDDSGTSRESTAEDKDSCRVKGKGLLTHNRSLKESDAKTRPLPGRTLACKVAGASPANEDACIRSEGASGWISTRDRTRRISLPLSCEEPRLSRRTDDMRKDNRDGNNARKHSVSSQNVSAASIVQTVSQKHQGYRLNDHHGPSNTVIKRQRHGSFRSHQGESSSSAIGNSELVVLGSSGEPSNVRSARTQNSHTARSFNRTIDIDEFSPETRSTGSCDIDCSTSSASDVRDRQLEADEILARELQEQLYNESNVAADREIDEHVALALQQENFQHGFSSRGHHASHPRSSSISNLHRENISRSSQNSSTQRVTQPRVPTSTRMARLRGRFPGQPRTVSSRQRNLFFPPNMDVDMRMNILETLEAFNDMGMAGGLLQAQRDFNENDYEMLLALDENNHQHGGASAAQINALPESTVQTDNLEECSICLETPSIGDTIRHLPCLHKFHKDCIDEWVRRRTSCPICKSSVT